MTYIGKVLRGTRGEGGATAVEFVIVLPVMLLTFAVIVEGARIYWNYQAAVAGVRDASRYLARITNNDVCGTTTSTGNTLTDGANIAWTYLERSLGDGGGNVFPSAITPLATRAVFDCVSVNNGVGVVPIARVSADVEIRLPLNNLWGFFSSGNSQLDRVESQQTGFRYATITDQSRIYGL